MFFIFYSGHGALVHTKPHNTSIDISSLRAADIHDVVGMGNQHHKVLDSLDIPIPILGVKIRYTFYILEQLWHAVMLTLIDFFTFKTNLSVLVMSAAKMVLYVLIKESLYQQS